MLVTTFSLAQVSDEEQENTDNRGTSGFAFLKIPASARHLALGEAAYSQNYDASAMFLNISELADIKGTSMFYTKQNLFDNLLYMNNFAISTKIAERWGIGASVKSLTTEEMEITTLDDPEGTGITYKYSDIALGAGFAYRATKRFSIGAKLKIVSESIAKTTANAFLIDVATEYRLNFANTRISTMFENYGPDTSFEGDDLWAQVDTTDGSDTPDQTDPNRNVNLIAKEFGAPAKITVAISTDILGEKALYKMNDNTLTFHTALSKSNDQLESGNFGMEYSYSGLSGFNLSLRGGAILYQEEDWDNKYSMGGGLNYEFSEKSSMTLDYAFRNHNDLDQTHVFSLIMNF